jgi:hypothetical protein
MTYRNCWKWNGKLSQRLSRYLCMTIDEATKVYHERRLTDKVIVSPLSNFIRKELLPISKQSNLTCYMNPKRYFLTFMLSHKNRSLNLLIIIVIGLLLKIHLPYFMTYLSSRLVGVYNDNIWARLVFVLGYEHWLHQAATARLHLSQDELEKQIL